MPGTIVFLPTYNEKEYITEVVQQILDLAPTNEVLVVDDNSPDGTADIVRQMQEQDKRIHLMIRHDDRGRGRAAVDAIRWFLERDYDYMIEMDADGSHDPAYIPAITESLQHADVIVCSRLIPGGGQGERSTLRSLITVLANRYIRFILGLEVNDCTTGYRGYRREALARLNLDTIFSRGPAIVQELLLMLMNVGCRVKEIPFVFKDRKAGRSKLGLGLLLLSLVNVWSMKNRHGKTEAAG